ncbi:hypothetical protein CLOM_g1922 [Closterium sp. NIES-68]|nr:hypothetical protein CLOM_g1922 [Closterium sp. NIES-68]GJP78937.1 hypothetical protein CLOP_g9196 [Closterium sp. NIES-67]GJP82487.1 hypothetical protein CLOP_g12742 [Closterium sp. NIES-67]
MLAFSQWVAAAADAAAKLISAETEQRKLTLTITYGPYFNASGIPLPAIMQKVHRLEGFKHELERMGFVVVMKKSQSVGLVEISCGPHRMFFLNSPHQMEQLASALVQQEEQKEDSTDDPRWSRLARSVLAFYYECYCSNTARSPRKL